MLAILAVVILLLLFLFLTRLSENFSQDKNDNPDPYIRLFERFNGKNMVFDFTPLSSMPSSLYFRGIVKVNLESLDINLPLRNDGLDDERKVEIWKMNEASSESDFYNPYTEPDFARRANDARYQLLISMKAGNTLKLNMSEPVKKVFIYARV